MEFEQIFLQSPIFIVIRNGTYCIRCVTWYCGVNHELVIKASLISNFLITSFWSLDKYSGRCIDDFFLILAFLKIFLSFPMHMSPSMHHWYIIGCPKFCWTRGAEPNKKGSQYSMIIVVWLVPVKSLKKWSQIINWMPQPSFFCNTQWFTHALSVFWYWKFHSAVLHLWWKWMYLSCKHWRVFWPSQNYCSERKVCHQSSRLLSKCFASHKMKKLLKKFYFL